MVFTGRAQAVMLSLLLLGAAWLLVAAIITLSMEPRPAEGYDDLVWQLNIDPVTEEEASEGCRQVAPWVAGFAVTGVLHLVGLACVAWGRGTVVSRLAAGECVWLALFCGSGFGEGPTASTLVYMTVLSVLAVPLAIGPGAVVTTPLDA